MRFPGIIPAVTTPFDADGAVDTAAPRRQRPLPARRRRATGSSAPARWARPGSLDAAERRLVLETVVEAVDGARAGDRRASRPAPPPPSIAYARDAADAGADAVMCLPPLGYRADLAELSAFYGAVAEGAGLPVMLYNNPEASGVDLLRASRSSRSPTGSRASSRSRSARATCAGSRR